MSCYCLGTQTTPIIYKPREKIDTGLDPEGTPMKVAWGEKVDPGTKQVTKFEHVKSKTRKWRALNPSNCNENSKCKGMGLAGTYTIRTDKNGFSKIRIDG